MIKITSEKVSDVVRNTYAVTTHYYHGDSDFNEKETFYTTNSDVVERWFRFAEALKADNYRDWSVVGMLYAEYVGFGDDYTVYDVWKHDKANNDAPVAIDYVECTFYDAVGTQWKCEVKV